MSQLKRAYQLQANHPGQTMTEYALILATIAVVLVSFINTAGVIVTGLVNAVNHLL
jgi:Flp pilus assembly pilin Flp